MRQARWIALILILPLTQFPLELLARPTDADGALERARSLVARGDDRQAATLLEDNLSDAAPEDRGSLIELLRQCYTTLIKRSEAAGKVAEAAALREDLEILDAAEPGTTPDQAVPQPGQASPNPSPRPPAASAAPQPSTSSTPPAELRPLPRAASPSEMETLREPAPAPMPDSLPSLSGPETTPSTRASATPDASASGGGVNFASTGRVSPGRTVEAAPAASPPVVGALAPSPEAGPRQASPGSNARETGTPEAALAHADRLFNAKRYDEAGRAYARMAASNELPAQRKQVWAYCRWVSVVARINAHPRDSREWDAIEQEIRSIQRLTPGNWYGEYLQNRVAEARKTARPAGRAGRLVVRGSEPDETTPRRLPQLFGRSRGAGPSTPPSVPAEEATQPLSLPVDSNEELSPPAAPTASPPEALRDEPAGESSTGTEQLVAAPRDAAREALPTNPAAPAPLAWQVRESANFRIYHMDPVLAEKASVAAEAVRTQQARRWGSSAARSKWSPACDIYLYPTPRDFAEMTGQPETSPGFSTMGLNGSRITSRRLNLRGDHPQLLTAILPHEVTHVVLADLFTQQQIPRWADEGMAVLAEPLAEQMHRAADLTKPLEEGRVFKLNELMAIDYPNAEAWSLYYAQSVSITQFLVQQGTPEQFIRFVHASQRGGVEAALQEVYRIDGFTDLENRWQGFARRQAAEIAALNRDGGVGTEATRRR